VTDQTSYEQAMKAATESALQMTFERVMTLPPEQVIPYMTSMVQIGVELLRAGGKEDAFVREFLGAATASLDSPPKFTLKDLRVH
jgi:hypothetical protein